MNAARKTVLVVEDNAVNRTLLTKLLDNGGYQTRMATDGSEALAALEREPVDAILLDLVMPGVDGMTVLRSIKSDVRHWRTPVIVVSAVEETDSIVQCLELGAEDYVTKPYDPVILRARLDACLARQRFHDIEREYQALVEEQAVELQRLHASLEAQASATREPMVPHRAEVGVVAIGLGGLPALVARLDPGEAAKAVSVLHSAVIATADRSRAVVAAFTPQVITLVINQAEDPGATFDAGERLARRCLEDLGPLLARWNAARDAVLAAGAGVAVGQALLGAIGDPKRFGAVGAVVDEAEARCRSALARGGGVVADDG